MIKKLTGSIREYSRASILTPVLVSIEVILECLIPLISANLVNYFNGNFVEPGKPVTREFSLFGTVIEHFTGDMQLWHIIVYALILIGMASLALVFGVLSGQQCAKASTGFAKNLRRDVFYNVQSFSFENIDKYQTSSLVTRLTTDITNIQNSYMMIIRVAVRAPLMFVFSLIMSFSLNWALTLIFVGAVPILVFTILMVMRQVMPIFKRVFKKYDKMNLRVQEDLHGIRVVKAFVREDYEIEKFETAAKDIRKDFVKAERLMAIVMPFISFMLYLIMMLLCLFGSMLVVSSNNGAVASGWYGTLSVGNMSGIIQYSMMAFMSLMMLAMVIVTISMSFESARRVCEVLDEKSVLVSPENGVSEVADGSIEFVNVGFSYSGAADKLALSGVNLKIESGMTVGILGATGAAKTTLVQLIPRLYDSTEGQVLVGGRNVKEYDLTALRKQVAMVLQKNVLFSGTIKENLLWGNPEAGDKEIVEACKLAQADDFIMSFPNKYDTHIEQSGTNVSGGQRQRLCIARALLAKPKIIIFDDSTSAVDTKTDKLIRNAMASEISDTTKIIIAQRVDSVKEADMIIIMENGKIDAVGTHDELLKSSTIYQEVFYSQRKEDGK